MPTYRVWRIMTEMGWNIACRSCWGDQANPVLVHLWQLSRDGQGNEYVAVAEVEAGTPEGAYILTENPPEGSPWYTGKHVRLLSGFFARREPWTTYPKTLAGRYVLDLVMPTARRSGIPGDIFEEIETGAAHMVLSAGWGAIAPPADRQV